MLSVLLRNIDYDYHLWYLQTHILPMTQWLEEKGQTTQWLEEKGQTTQWLEEKDRQHNG
jgi:hypothetical protein